MIFYGFAKSNTIRIIECICLPTVCYQRIWENSRWRHQMETFPRNWPFVLGIRRSPVNSPHKSQWCGALMFSFICARMNGWVNNREAGYLRRHRAHYDVTVMWADWKTSGKRHLISCFWIQSVSETAEKYIVRYMKSLHRINSYNHAWDLQNEIIFGNICLSWSIDQLFGRRHTMSYLSYCVAAH